MAKASGRCVWATPFLLTLAEVRTYLTSAARAPAPQTM